MKASRILALLLVILPMVVQGGVNLKNGNFYISYTDIIVPGGGHDLYLARTYNSQATEKGWFGLGWGSAFETNLTPAADGSVVIRENGSGASTRFTPKQAVDPKTAAQRVIEAMRKRSPMSDKVADSLLKKLESDAELRQAYARKFKVQAKIANGTVLYSNERGLQQVHKTADGYKRVYNDGKTEFFNEDGKLAKIVDKNNYTITMNYEKGGLKSIKDSQAKQLFFDWYADGKIKTAWSVGDKKVSYKYKGDDLVETNDVGGNKFVFGYDSNHNMTSISYTDGSSMEIKYQKRFVSEIKARDGKVTKYKYESNPKNPDYHYWTMVSKKGPNGKWVDNKYEYELKSRPDGSHYTYRIYTKINGVETETVYSECCSLPLKIKRGEHVTTFEYNDKGLLTKKTSTKGDYIQLDYHKELNKITYVKDNKGWTKFKYNKKGDLEEAENSAGKQVLLVYDRKGRIQKMLDKDSKSKKTRSLAFKYNALGKPIEIEMKNVGVIKVDYDNYGEIKKVESKAGHKMALQVTQAFQSLLSIVKPAGVNLNM